MERKKLMIIKADGTRTTKEFEGAEPPLEDLQEAVGGYIEVVPMRFTFEKRKARLFVNEDGIAKNLPLNQNATSLCGGFHRILGDAVLVQE